MRQGARDAFSGLGSVTLIGFVFVALALVLVWVNPPSAKDSATFVFVMTILLVPLSLLMLLAGLIFKVIGGSEPAPFGAVDEPASPGEAAAPANGKATVRPESIWPFLSLSLVLLGIAAVIFHVRLWSNPRPSGFDLILFFLVGIAGLHFLGRIPPKPLSRDPGKREVDEAKDAAE